MKNRVFMAVLVLAVLASNLSAQTSTVDATKKWNKAQEKNKEIAQSIQAAVAENTHDIAAVVCDSVGLVKNHPQAALATVLAVASLSGIYKTKDAIIRFVKEYPYAIASLFALSGAAAGVWHYNIPLKTCAYVAGTACITVPLKAAQWMQGVMTIKFAWDYIKNAFNEEDTQIGSTEIV